MQKKENINKEADQILHDKIMQEGEYLRKVLGPITYEDPEDYDLEESFQKLLKDREELKAETKKKKAKTTRKSFGSLAKAAAIILVAGSCLIGFSLQSEATRMWWMESMEWLYGDDSSTRVDNDEDRDLTVLPEVEAIAVIEKELGIQVPELIYKPEWMIFSDYEYETVNKSATVYYKFEEIYLSIHMLAGIEDSASVLNFDGNVLKEESITTSFGTVRLKMIKAEQDIVETMVAEWDYQEAHYRISGKISYEEMKRIVENIMV